MYVCFSLGPLVNKVKEYQVETIVENLCNNLVSEKEQLRDISSIGLKTVISELPLGSSALAANVCKRITGRLSNAIEKVLYKKTFQFLKNKQQLLNIKLNCEKLLENVQELCF